MKTLIIPCAGKSSRFPGMRPKWMLTHPDGKPMVQKAVENFGDFDRIIITIVREHDEKYEASLFVRQVFKDNPKVETCILDDFTKSQSETVYKTLEKMGVRGAFVVKDSDNSIDVALPADGANLIVGYDVDVHRDVSNIPAKSFIVSNEQNIVLDIVEKKVVSNIICLGIYGFKDAAVFMRAFERLSATFPEREMYLSHVISYLISQGNAVFNLFYSTGYEDWGTLAEWRATQKKCQTYLVDIDGVLMKNCGQYGSFNWDNNNTVLEENVEQLRKLQQGGAMIIIITSRPEKYRASLLEMLAGRGVVPHAMVMGVNHAKRVLVNDFAPTNPYPSAEAVNIPRNGRLADYLSD